MEEKVDPVHGALVKAGVDAATEAGKVAQGFLMKIVGPAADEYGGLLKDKVAAIRYRNLVKILAHAKAMCDEAGIDAASIPLKVLNPILDGASLEDEPDLQSKWAALMANAATGDAKIDPSFAHIMMELSAMDVAILNVLMANERPEWRGAVLIVLAPNPVGGYGAVMGMEQPGTGKIVQAARFDLPFEARDVRPLRRSLQKLASRLALVEPLTPEVKQREEGIEIIERYMLTTLGLLFTEACQPPTPSRT